MEKRKRLAYVARRYYLDDQRQSDIARDKLGLVYPDEVIFKPEE